MQEKLIKEEKVGRQARSGTQKPRTVIAKKALLASLLSLLVLLGASCEPVPFHVVLGFAFLLGLIALWLVFIPISAIACPLLARESGKNPWGYFFLGFLLSLVGLVITVWVTGRSFSTAVKIIGIPILVASVPLIFLNGVGIIVLFVLASISGVLSGLTWLVCHLIDPQSPGQASSPARATSSQWQ